MDSVSSSKSSLSKPTPPPSPSSSFRKKIKALSLKISPADRVIFEPGQTIKLLPTITLKSGSKVRKNQIKKWPIKYKVSPNNRGTLNRRKGTLKLKKLGKVKIKVCVADLCSRSVSLRVSQTEEPPPL